MTKSRDELKSIEANSLKFNDTIIKRLNSNISNNIYLNQISQFNLLHIIKNVDLFIINSRNKIRINSLSKKKYVTQRVRDVYVALICLSKTFLICVSLFTQLKFSQTTSRLWTNVFSDEWTIIFEI